MKYLNHSIFYFLLLLLFYSCKQEKIATEAPYLRIPESGKILQFGKDMLLDQLISIETNIEDLSVSADQDWCTITTISSNIQKLLLQLTENKERGVRKALVTLTGSGQQAQFTIEQLGTDPALLINREEITMRSSASQETFSITTNLEESEYDIILPENIEWITIALKAPESRSMVTREYELSVSSNPGTEKREADVTFRSKAEAGKEVSASLHISQEGASVADVEVEGDIKVRPVGGVASQYQPGQGIENSFDGVFDKNKPYHSPWGDGTQLPVTLEYFFEGTEAMDYFIYHPNGGNGDFGEFTLYVADKGSDTYRELGNYNFYQSATMKCIYFDQRLEGVKKIKFEVKSGNGGFVSCQEMEFFRSKGETELERNLLAVFTDLTCCEVKEEATDKDIARLPGVFASLAQTLRKGSYNEWEKKFRVQDYSPYSNTDVWAEKLAIKPYSALNNITGIYVNSGDEVIFCVGETHNQNIAVQCIGEEINNEGKAQTAVSGESYLLKKGINKCRFTQSGMLFVIYTADLANNPAPIRIHVLPGSGHVSGYWNLVTDKTDEIYKDLLSRATYKYFGVRGKDIMFYFHTQRLREFVPDQILSAITLWDNIIGWELELMGIEDVRPSQFNNKIMAISPEYGYMWASPYRIGFVDNYLGNILLKEKVMEREDNAWGPAHEIGHLHQAAINWPGSSESSNNLFSNYIIYNLGKYKSRGMGLCKVAQSIYGKDEAWYNMSTGLPKEDQGKGNEDTEVHMRMNWQLWIYFHRLGYKKDFWQQLFKALRNEPVPESNPGKKQMLFARKAAEVAHMNLTDFFEMWGFFKPVDSQINQYGTFQYTVTEAMIKEVKDYMATLPAPTHAFQYIEDRKKTEFEASDYRSWQVGDVGYMDQFKAGASTSLAHPTYTESRGTDKEGTSCKVFQITGAENAVAFEWRKDSDKGKIVYFGNSFEFYVPETVSLEGAKLFAVSATGQRVEITKQ